MPGWADSKMPTWVFGGEPHSVGTLVNSFVLDFIWAWTSKPITGCQIPLKYNFKIKNLI